MKRALCHSLFILALLVAVPAQAQKPAIPPALNLLLSHCLPALTAGTSPAEMATDFKLSEFAPEQALKFAPEGGRVFAVPNEIGNAVFITNKNFEGVCSVAVREADAAQYHLAVNEWFGGQSPFKLIRETRNDELKQTRRDYRADIGAIPLVVFITIADAPRNGGIQILMTAARVQKEDQAKK